jgi:predicted aspartyl protease
MLGIRSMLLVAAGGLISTAVLQQAVPMDIAPPDRVDVPDSGVTLPMLDVGGRPMIDVSVNGQGPYPFILDTGASVTAISADLIEKLALPLVSGTPLPAPARVAELRVGGAVLHGLTVIPEPMIGSLGGATPPRGILSASYFPGSLVILNYPAKTVSIHKGALPAPDNRRVFAYPADDILPTVPVTVAGHEFRPHVDTGSPGSLTLPMAAADVLPLTEKPTEIGRARTPGGEFPVLAAKVSAPVTLGEYDLDLKELRFSDLRPGSRPAVGNMGYQALRAFVVTLDSKNHRLKFER